MLVALSLAHYFTVKGEGILHFEEKSALRDGC